MLTMYTRSLEAVLRRSNRSVLLLGPRQVGKSTLMRRLGPDLAIDLADEAEFLAHAADPAVLRQRIEAVRPKQVLVDEIQRLPRMLNTIQSVLDQPRAPRFLLTGSSARKLRRGRANLLPGRVHAYRLGPLTVEELGADFDEATALSTGMLPGISSETNRDDRIKTLRSYASTYVREEIQAEALTRSIEGFARFLRVAAAVSGQFVDQSRLAREAAVTRATLARYFEILEDTLLALRLDAFAKSERRRIVQHPKFFVFDVGVYNALVGSFDVGADRAGTLLEHFVGSQIYALAHAADVEPRISSYRTEHGAEVDVIVEHGRELWAIEIKSSRQFGASDASGLRSFAEFYGRKHRSLIAYRGSDRRRSGPIEIIPYRDLLVELAAWLRA